MKSKRADGLGHWPKGKPRTTLTAPQIAASLRRLNRALQEQSMRAVSRVLGISDTQVRRLKLGHDLPSAATAALISERL